MAEYHTRQNDGYRENWCSEDHFSSIVPLSSTTRVLLVQLHLRSDATYRALLPPTCLSWE